MHTQYERCSLTIAENLLSEANAAHQKTPWSNGMLAPGATLHFIFPETVMADSEDRLKALEERVEKLEKQIATLLKRSKPAVPPRRPQDMRDSYDALDYPER